MAWEQIRHFFGRSREDIEAQDEAHEALRAGTTPIGQAQPRSRVEVYGILRAVTYSPQGANPRLIGQLYDGTGSIDLVWMGRRNVAGIEPGRHVRASGMVLSGYTRPTIFNPNYELMPA